MALTAAEIGLLVSNRLGVPAFERPRLQTLIDSGLEKLARQVVNDRLKRSYLMTNKSSVTASVARESLTKEVYYADLSTIISTNGVMLDRLEDGVIYHTYPTISTANTNVNTTTDTISATSSFPTGLKVRVTTDGGLPTGITASTDYYTIFVSATSFKLASSRANAAAGTAIDITAQGAGNHTFTPQESDILQWGRPNMADALPVSYVSGWLVDTKLYLNAPQYWTGITGNAPTLGFAVPAVPTLSNLHAKLESDLIDVIVDLARTGSEIDE